jgi:hypothetical protein
MLRKLIRYDFKALTRILFPFFGGVLALSLLASVMMRITTNFSLGNGFVESLITMCATFFIALAFIALAACTLITLLLVAWHYYKNLMSSEGYLTFTLPVTPTSILTSKLITGFVSVLISLVVTVLSIVLLIVLGTANLTELHLSLTSGFQTLILELGNVWDGDMTLCTVLVVCAVVVSILFSLLTIYMSISLGGKLSSKHKLLMAVVVYLGLNMITNILTVPLYGLLIILVKNLTDPLQIFNWFLGFSSIWIAIFSAICFVICRRLLSKNLNLD